MDLSSRLQDDRFYGRASKALIGLLLAAVLGMAVYYYFDRYHAARPSLVDQDIARLEQMIANDPSNARTRLALANLYLTKDAYANAITQYGEALKLEDQNLTALAGMGLAFFKAAKPKEAAAAFERLLELVQDNPTAQRTPLMSSVHYYLGRIYRSQGDLAGAEGELRLALGIDRSDADTIYELAEVVSQQGRARDALGLYRAAVRLVPAYTEAYAGLGRAYSAAGLREEASYADAMVDYSRGAYDAAITKLQAVVQAKPDFAEAYYGLGAAYDKKNERDKAIAAYQQSLQLQPDNEGARVSLIRLGVQPSPNATPAKGH